ncbi:hypothetical protein [Abyssisolibacter fermentans]|uniref:hypothetical protein n=1 Tax=Abyssisolibacter fermentans TaxID=1766203 RepID=UPI001FA7B9FD|nr:hypothetical protein [Abyssisolibacter fermentans]
MEKELLSAIREIMREELKPIRTQLDEHTVILNEHTEILNEHTEILNQHTIILNEHSQKLDEHSQKLDEHSQILRALEHSAEIAKAERDIMMHDIAEVKCDVTAIKKDLYRVEEATANNWADIAKLKKINNNAKFI